MPSTAHLCSLAYLLAGVWGLRDNPPRSPAHSTTPVFVSGLGDTGSGHSEWQGSLACALSCLLACLLAEGSRASGDPWPEGLPRQSPRAVRLRGSYSGGREAFPRMHNQGPSPRNHVEDHHRFKTSVLWLFGSSALIHQGLHDGVTAALLET